MGNGNMKLYKGYYIDRITFNNEREIDNFLEQQAIKAYRTAVEMFTNHPDMEHSFYMDDKAQYLVEHFGYTWDHIESLEIEIMKATA